MLRHDLLVLSVATVSGVSNTAPYAMTSGQILHGRGQDEVGCGSVTTRCRRLGSSECCRRALVRSCSTTSACSSRGRCTQLHHAGPRRLFARTRPMRTQRTSAQRHPPRREYLTERREIVSGRRGAKTGSDLWIQGLSVECPLAVPALPGRHPHRCPHPCLDRRVEAQLSLRRPPSASLASPASSRSPVRRP